MRTPEEQASIEQVWKQQVGPGTSLQDIFDVLRSIDKRFPDPGVRELIDQPGEVSLDRVLELIREMTAQGPAPEVQEALVQARADLVASGIAGNALHEGDLAPDFTLPDHQGDLRTLSRMLQQGRVVLSFYRGSWCPYCNLELRGLLEFVDEFAALGATLVAISPEPPDKASLTAEQLALRFAVLSDFDNKVAERFGLAMQIPEAIKQHQVRDIGIDVAHHNGGDYRVPIPATYVIESDATISLAYVNADYRYRLDPRRVLDHLRSAPVRESGSSR